MICSLSVQALPTDLPRSEDCVASHGLSACLGFRTQVLTTCVPFAIAEEEPRTNLVPVENPGHVHLYRFPMDAL